MIPRNAAPVLHRPVYQRIGRQEPVRPIQRYLPDVFSYSPTEAERVWRLVRQTAEGTNDVVEVEA